jgi:hypothetical protein
MRILKIKGECQTWLRAAASNLSKQLPFIEKEFPEISGCYLGTVNLLLDFPLLVISPDHRTNPIPWDPRFGVGEIFDFLRIEIEAPVGTSRVPAWLYIGHGSVHRADCRKHEVLGPKLNVKIGDRCCIIIKKKIVELPYMKKFYLVV